MIFPLGTIYSVSTDKNSIFCKGHFLISQVMNQFVDILGKTKLDPTQINNLKLVDFCQILENFILKTLYINTNNLN